MESAPVTAGFVTSLFVYLQFSQNRTGAGKWMMLQSVLVYIVTKEELYGALTL